MNVIACGLLAIALYLIVAVRMSGRATLPPRANRDPLTIVLCVVALGAHGATLYPLTVTGAGINLGLFPAASLVSWIVVALALTAAMLRPVASLTVVVLPFAAVLIALSLTYTSENLVRETPGLAMHIALSLVAYSLFAIATVQAIYLMVAEQRLKRHQPVIGFLPPLPVMEATLFQLTGVAFVLLSLGLITGSFYVDDVRAQHLSHKIVFSMLAWCVFISILWGRHYRHWRGRKASKYVIGGFVSLAVGFFGSKVALELILERV